MNIFTWLLVGHLLGDWLLQNDWMAKGKKQSLFNPAGMVHFTVYTVTIVGTLWLLSSTNKGPVFYLILGVFVFVSHWLIDATRVVDNWIRFYHQSDSTMVRVMVDQTLHILVLAIVTILA